jgi:hypothetical protein
LKEKQMFSTKHRLGMIVGSSALVLWMIAGSLPAQTSSSLEQTALQIVSNRTGYPASDLSVANSSEATYPLQGVSSTTFKINDPSGQIHGVVLNSSGAELDGEELEQGEQDAFTITYGRLDPRLYDRLQMSQPGDSIDVVIWLREPPSEQSGRPELVTDPSVPRPDEAEIEELFRKRDAEREAFVEALVAPVKARLASYGHVHEADPYAPALFATLPVEVIWQVNEWPEVDRIYEAPINAENLATARVTIGANIVNGRGINGAGVRVGVIEVGGRVAVANPFLGGGVLQDPAFVCAAPSGHSTGVTGIIRSNHGVHTGIASGTMVYAGGSCFGFSNQLNSRSTAAADWGARALNLSWGANIGLVPGANDRFYDNMVLNRWRTVVVAAGNEAGPCGSGTGNTLSPAMAYNVITVGNFNDRTGGAPTMNVCSSWRNPVSWINDREKPEVSAPGTNITSTTTAFPWIGPIGSGTSFSAPMVTGGTALLIQRNGFFSVWPEAVKALLMTTAVNNIEGAARLSQFDGAGGIKLNLADDVAGGVTGGASGQGYNCAAPVNTDVATIWLASGIKTRVTIVWDNDPAYVNYANRPSADLDLQVINPVGGIVANSASWDNTYEIVEFIPAMTGFHKIRVNKFRCNLSPQWLGWAWRQI